MNEDMIRKQMDLYYQATRIPLCLFDRQNMLKKSSHPTQDFNLPLLLLSGVPTDLPDIWYAFTPEYVYFGGIRIKDSDRLLLLLVGPVMLYECSNMQAASLCRRLGRKSSDTEMLRQYFSLTGPHHLDSLLANLLLLCQLLALPAPDPKEIPLLPFSWNLPYTVSLAQDMPAYEPIPDNLEAELLSCVTSGNLQAINRLLSEKIHSTPVVLSLPVTAMRSYILGANMVASRAAITAGVDYQLANAMSGQYIERILQARNGSELSELFFRFFQDYTEKVAELHALPSDSPIVKFVHQYTVTHYGEKITPHTLAEHLNMSCPYLCSHFKEETGMTIASYVRWEKVREAKRLLKGSRYSIVEISEALAFSSESYFCAVFKKITGMTPQSYRSSPSVIQTLPDPDSYTE